MKKPRPLDDTLLEKATVTLMVGALELATKILPSEKQSSVEKSTQHEESAFEHSEHFRKPR